MLQVAGGATIRTCRDGGVRRSRIFPPERAGLLLSMLVKWTYAPARRSAPLRSVLVPRQVVTSYSAHPCCRIRRPTGLGIRSGRGDNGYTMNANR